VSQWRYLMDGEGRLLRFLYVARLLQKRWRYASDCKDTTLATKKVTIYTEILLSCEYCVEQNLLPRAHLRGIFTGMAIIETANATLLKFWPR